ncbi:hypothetical protein H4R35_007226 [Dimargaris xerosporica]|nr:hypothetical protein H4R35_007226 [Dimargaris xerosporica]
MVVATVTRERKRWRDPTHMLIFIQPAILVAQAAYILYYGVVYLRKLPGLPARGPTLRDIRKLICICLLVFFIYVFQATSAVLMSQYRENDITFYVVRYVCYRVSSLLLIGSIFWFLRVHQSLEYLKDFTVQLQINPHSLPPHATDKVPSGGGNRHSFNFETINVVPVPGVATAGAYTAEPPFSTNEDYHPHGAHAHSHAHHHFQHPHGQPPQSPHMYSDPSFVLNPVSGSVHPPPGGLSGLASRSRVTSPTPRFQIP